MKVLVVPMGSHGDVHPFLGLGEALRERGHHVTFLLIEHFGPLVRSLGFESIPLGDDALYLEIMRNPDIWHPRRAFSVVAGQLDQGTRKTYELIERHREPGRTLVVGSTLAWGARVAGEKLGIPTATVHLQPASLHTVHDIPEYEGKVLPKWWPMWMRRGLFDLLHRKIVDPQVAPALNAFRSELGLPPVRFVVRNWMHSPELVLGFFPEWFGPKQPDWPANYQSVGFPLFDEREVTPIEPELARFLDEGSAPIAFTPGSANIFGRPFFEAAVEACRLLGRRGLLLTRFPEQVPKDLPDTVRHVPFAPFSLLLPKTAALVHHGGVGTAAQGMASAVPQLVMPLAHDQFDNVGRMERLGIARRLLPKHFKGPAAAKVLGTLIDNPEVLQNCRNVAAKFAEDPHPMQKACEALEALAQRSSPAVQ